MLAGCTTLSPSPTATPTEQTVTATATQVPLPDVPTAVPTQTAACTPTATTTPPPTNTATPIPAYTLSGTVFFDYNGNGLRDEGEPPIEGVPIRVAGLSTSSGPDGKYLIAGVPAGTQQVHVESPRQEPATAFRYINRFLGWVDIPAYEMNGVRVPAQHLADTEFQPIDKPVALGVSEDQALDMALMQGYLTLPFDQATDNLLWSYVDLDHRIGHIRNYANESVPAVDPYIDIDPSDAHPGTHDNHQGIDYNMANGNLLLAMANGTVVQERSQYHYVRIQHTGGSDVYVTGYEHNLVNLVSEGSRVRRGQIIALSGDWDNGRYADCQPHVHIHHWIIPNDWAHDPLWYVFELKETVPFSGDVVQVCDDPYRDVSDANAVSYWTVDNHPQFPPVS